jgi:hypothetical protein
MERIIEWLLDLMVERPRTSFGCAALVFLLCCCQLHAQTAERPLMFDAASLTPRLRLESIRKVFSRLTVIRNYLCPRLPVALSVETWVRLIGRINVFGV